MAEKKLKISLDLDDKAFTSAIKNIQQQINKINSTPALLQQQREISNKMQQMGIGALPGAPGSGDIKQSQQKAQQEIDKIFQESTRKLTLAKRLQQDLTAEIQKTNRQLIDSNITEKERIVLLEREKELHEKMSQAKTAETTATVGGASVAEYKKQQTLGKIGDFTKGATVLAEAAMLAGNIYGNLMRRPIETQALTGSATQGTIGREVGAAYSGRQGFEMAFMPEKAKATQMAMESMKGVVFRDWAKAIGGTVIQTIAGAAGGALAGSAVPILGTTAGAIVGGIAGLGRAVSDKDTYNTLSLSKEAREAVNARRAAEFSNNLGEAYEGLKNQNPLKLMATEKYNQNYARDLEFQRGLGLNYESFHGKGGFREKAVNAGFTDEIAMKISNEIMAAGGSTRMGKNSIFAAQAARGLDVTNSGQILGGLSQTLGTDRSSQQAFVKMFAEGQKIGLDSSNFRDEMRKFLDINTQLISRSETTSQSDISGISKRFAGFVGEEPTQRGLQAAKGAFETFNQVTSSNSGPSGVMRAAAFIKDESIGKFSAMDRASLASIPADQLATDHPVIQNLADKYKISPEDLVKRTRRAGSNALHRLPEGDILTKKLISKRENLRGPLSLQEMDKRGTEIKKLENQLAGVTSVEYPQLAKSRKELESFVRGTTQPEEGRFTGGSLDDIKKRMEKKETERPEDETVRGLAESNRLMLDTFREFKDQIIPTADAIGKFNDRLKETVEIVMKLPESERAGLLQKLYSGLIGGGKDKSSTQSQTGR